MKKITQILCFVALCITTTVMAQTTLKGVVVADGLPLPGANIVEKGTSNGSSTDFDGNFTLQATVKSGTIVISYVGFTSITLNFDGSKDFGTLTLEADNALDEIVIVGSGVIDLAEDRKTPVAVSTIRRGEIQEKAGNWDLPEVLKSTPSVQNIKSGGFGDGQMFLRGFDQTNTAFLLNGQPINGMEDGKMYWSNWSGVLDVANAIQVQRGLGSSKLAISSVGGTVNIVTKTIDNKRGGFFQQMIANDDYTKTSAYYSTGKNEKGWSFSAMLGHWQGDGYVNYTHGQGQTYFLSVGYQPNESHTFNFLLTGAPQWHAAAGSGTIKDFLENGRKYNSWNQGNVNSSNTLDGPRGKRYPGGRNIYHKPVANLSWDWNINEKSSLSSVLYGSIGRGAFASERIDSDGNGYVRGSYNNHNWFGLVSNYNNELSETLNLNVGADIRTYNGIHFRGVNEFVGSTTSVEVTSGYSGTYRITDSFGGINPWNMVFNPNTDHDQRMDRDYEEVITYYGMFGQLEYSKNKVSAFFQGALSNQDHQREEFFFTEEEGVSEKSKKVSNIGYNLKAGAAYAINDSHKVFVNAGFYSRQPFHDDLFVNTRNSNDLINPEVENQTITGFEAGYQFAGSKVSANINLYHTIWDKRTLLSDNGEEQESPDYEGYQTQGVKQVHQGIELEVFTRPFENLKVNGYVALGQWEFADKATQRTFDGDGNEIGSSTELDIDGFKVGGAAQVTAGANFIYEFLPRFSVDGTWNWYNDFYSTGSLAVDPIALPSYDTVDAGLSYKMLLGKDKSKSLQFRVNVNNVFDEVYLESVSGNTPMSANPEENYKGVNTSNNGRFGYGRTWNVSLRYNF
ncbi:TonB-dependent receptor domain-containing protein [Psychroserpens sp. S379A]|uniref:TonB-dependent receptor n=1 Tax=Psychroserpens sp. S379A TaxID=3415137 RepID=UPI003C7D66AD